MSGVEIVKTGAKPIEAGLAQEVKARESILVNRDSEQGTAFALELTAAGAKVDSG